MGHINESKSFRFTKTTLYFILANYENPCEVEMRKKVNTGDGGGLQVPYTLQFSGKEDYLEIFIVLASVIVLGLPTLLKRSILE